MRCLWLKGGIVFRVKLLQTAKKTRQKEMIGVRMQVWRLQPGRADPAGTLPVGKCVSPTLQMGLSFATSLEHFRVRSLLRMALEIVQLTILACRYFIGLPWLFTSPAHTLAAWVSLKLPCMFLGHGAIISFVERLVIVLSVR